MQAVIARLKALDEKRKRKLREKRDRKRRRKESNKEGDPNIVSSTSVATSDSERKIPPQNAPLEQNSSLSCDDNTCQLDGKRQRRKRERTETTKETDVASAASMTLAAAATTSCSALSVPSSPITTNNTLRERLPMGYFHGSTIFRNSLHPSEQREDGFVTLAELVPPDCQRILATTFCAPKAFEWLDQTILGGPYGKYPRPSHVLLVHHGPFPMGDPQLERIKVRRKQQENWYKLACQPHTGGCMHPKVILFRTKQGLRVVVSGNNFYQYQWENDRDCLWAQDFPISNGSKKNHQEEYHTSMPLRSFLNDLCYGTHHRFVKDHLEALFANIDLTQSKASLVYSLPPGKSNTGDRGGWKQLTQVVQDCLLDDYDTENDFNSPNTPDYSSPSDKPRYVLYTMSGSIGDVDPILLRCMKNAMTGQDTYFDEFPATNDKQGMVKEWVNISDIQCLLPSLETAQKMDSTWNGRLMSKSHWNSIPRVAQQNLFRDAIPNPNFERSKQRPKYPFAHAKVLYCKYTKLAFGPPVQQHQKPSILYVGSHNFSKAAWGIADRMPGNVEVGVVLSTSDPRLQEEWESRLPYLLTNGHKPSPNYRPLVEGDWKRISEQPDQLVVENDSQSTEERLGTQEPMSPKLKDR